MNKFVTGLALGAPTATDPAAFAAAIAALAPTPSPEVTLPAPGEDRTGDLD